MSDAAHATGGAPGPARTGAAPAERREAGRRPQKPRRPKSGAAAPGVGGASARGLVRTPARRAQRSSSQRTNRGHPDQAQAGRRGPGAARGGADHGGPRRRGGGELVADLGRTLRQGGHGPGGEGALAGSIATILEPAAAIPAGSGASAARDPGVRGQRHRQDHDDRQARPSVPLGRREGVLAAGDTFRAAAIEQLDIWGERAGCAVVKRPPGATLQASRSMR